MNDKTLVMQETYDGVVVEARDGTALVIYDVGEDRVEQTYDQSQFIGERLPTKGTRLRVQVEVRCLKKHANLHKKDPCNQKVPHE